MLYNFFPLTPTPNRQRACPPSSSRASSSSPAYHSSLPTHHPPPALAGYSHHDTNTHTQDTRHACAQPKSQQQQQHTIFHQSTAQYIMRRARIPQQQHRPRHLLMSGLVLLFALLLMLQPQPASASAAAAAAASGPPARKVSLYIYTHTSHARVYICIYIIMCSPPFLAFPPFICLHIHSYKRPRYQPVPTTTAPQTQALQHLPPKTHYQ